MQQVRRCGVPSPAQALGEARRLARERLRGPPCGRRRAMGSAPPLHRAIHGPSRGRQPSMACSPQTPLPVPCLRLSKLRMHEPDRDSPDWRSHTNHCAKSATRRGGYGQAHMDVRVRRVGHGWPTEPGHTPTQGRAPGRSRTLSGARSEGRFAGPATAWPIRSRSDAPPRQSGRVPAPPRTGATRAGSGVAKRSRQRRQQVHAVPAIMPRRPRSSAG